MSFSLNAPQRKQIDRRRNTRDYRPGMRLSALLWRDAGKTGAEIARRHEGVPRRASYNERRNGYAWLGSWPQRLPEKDYPAWKARHAGKKE